MLLDTPVCDFGWVGPEFSLKDALGKGYELNNSNNKTRLVMFICNHCPYVIRIAPQLSKVTSVLMSQGIEVFAIMSNNYRDYPEDSPENMIKFKKKYGFEFPYLLDEDQSVGKSYGAVCTPDFFGFNNRGELQYRGRIEELLSSMTEIARTGRGPKKQTPSMGCSIKWSQ